jgi:hypothetical protein
MFAQWRLEQGTAVTTASSGQNLTMEPVADCLAMVRMQAGALCRLLSRSRRFILPRRRQGGCRYGHEVGKAPRSPRVIRATPTPRESKTSPARRASSSEATGSSVNADVSASFGLLTLRRAAW